MRNRNNSKHKYNEDSLAFYLDSQRDKFKKHVKRVLSEIFYGDPDMKMLAMPITMESEDFNTLKKDLQELLVFYESLDTRIDNTTDNSRRVLKNLQRYLDGVDLTWLIEASSNDGFMYKLVNFCVEDTADEIYEKKYAAIDGYPDSIEHMGDAFSESVDIFRKMEDECSLDADRYFDELNSIPELLKEFLKDLNDEELADAVKFDKNLDAIVKVKKKDDLPKEPISIQKTTDADSDLNTQSYTSSSSNISDVKDTAKSQTTIDPNIVIMLKKGVKLVNDRAKLREYLVQNLKDDKLHLNLLIFAYNEGFLPKIYKATDKQETAQIYADRMIEHFGLTRENANWSISAWCQMFGYAVELNQDNLDLPIKSKVLNNSSNTVELGVGIYRCGVDLEPGEHAIVVDWNPHSKYKTHEMWCMVSDEFNSGFSGERILFRDKCYIKINDGEYLKIDGYGSCLEDLLRITATRI